MAELGGQDPDVGADVDRPVAGSHAFVELVRKGGLADESQCLGVVREARDVSRSPSVAIAQGSAGRHPMEEVRNQMPASRAHGTR